MKATEEDFTAACQAIRKNDPSFTDLNLAAAGPPTKEYCHIHTTPWWELLFL
jgi:hypothetical protein